jgi:hypothetical protein
LINDYGYKRKNVEMEFKIRIGSKSKRGDVVIFYDNTSHTQQNIFMIAEVKRYNSSTNHKDAFNQLYSYISACGNCKYGILVIGEEISYYSWEKKVDGRQFLVQTKGVPFNFDTSNILNTRKKVPYTPDISKVSNNEKMKYVYNEKKRRIEYNSDTYNKSSRVTSDVKTSIDEVTQGCIYGLVVVLLVIFLAISLSYCFDNSAKTPYKQSKSIVEKAYEITSTKKTKEPERNHSIEDTLKKLESLTIVSQNRFGGTSEDKAHVIDKTIDGGYIIGGSSSSSDGDISHNNGKEDIWVIKTDSKFNIEWEKSLGGNNTDYINSLKRTSDKGYIIIGTSTSKNIISSDKESNLWVVKLDNTGEILWEKSYNADYGHEIIEILDGGYIIGGTIDEKKPLKEEFYIAKIDEEGNVQWENSYGISTVDGNNSEEYLAAIQENPDKTFSVIGTTASKNEDVSDGFGTHNTDLWYLKIDSSGNILQNICYGGLEDEIATDIISTSDGGYLLVGGSKSDNGEINSVKDKGMVSFNWGNFDYWVVKIDNNGIPAWERSYGGTEDDIAFSVKEVNKDGFILFGETMSTNADVSINNGNKDLWIVKIDGMGNILWERSLGGSEDESISRGLNQFHSKVTFVNDGNGEYTFVATTKSSDGDIKFHNKGGEDVWVFKIPDSYE